MTETQRLESLLAGGEGGSVTLPRQDARELAQKLKARGETGAGTTRLAELLDRPGDVELNREEATDLLEELRASGRRWVFGTDEARPMPSMSVPEPEPAPEKERGFFARLFG